MDEDFSSQSPWQWYNSIILHIFIFTDFIPPSENGNSISVGAVVGIVAAGAFVIFLVLGILWWKGCLGRKSAMEQGIWEEIPIVITDFFCFFLKKAICFLDFYFTIFCMCIYAWTHKLVLNSWRMIRILLNNAYTWGYTYIHQTIYLWRDEYANNFFNQYFFFSKWKHATHLSSACYELCEWSMQQMSQWAGM